MFRLLHRLSHNWIGLLLCLGIAGASLDLDRLTDDPLRLHSRSRCSRTVRVGDDLHAPPHSDCDHCSHQFDPTLLPAVMPVAPAVAALARGQWLAAETAPLATSDPVLALPVGRAPPLA